MSQSLNQLEQLLSEQSQALEQLDTRQMEARNRLAKGKCNLLNLMPTVRRICAHSLSEEARQNAYCTQLDSNRLELVAASVEQREALAALRSRRSETKFRAIQAKTYTTEIGDKAKELQAAWTAAEQKWTQDLRDREYGLGIESVRESYKAAVGEKDIALARLEGTRLATEPIEREGAVAATLYKQQIQQSRKETEAARIKAAKLEIEIRSALASHGEAMEIKRRRITELQARSDGLQVKVMKKREKK